MSYLTLHLTSNLVWSTLFIVDQGRLSYNHWVSTMLIHVQFGCLALIYQHSTLLQMFVTTISKYMNEQNYNSFVVSAHVKLQPLSEGNLIAYTSVDRVSCDLLVSATWKITKATLLNIRHTIFNATLN